MTEQNVDPQSDSTFTSQDSAASNQAGSDFESAPGSRPEGSSEGFGGDSRAEGSDMQGGAQNARSSEDSGRTDW
ncbi:hypothetical protein [Brevibacterium jeotgali]|uniref:Uncharacterized protein n=1 Tax=Brevibacterium jeotgali TaxID=1262550 RepID=A0A2H1L3P9_9MICO|nr:hypothetical protein [Brevibacterium jeotgali]TWC01781.1 hypothetical protein FB108_0435 [Brevibacterium jeotgali]SMY11526.1 hypothetical protein BJEO58_01111 [Brevibacterium jeotgali]